MSARGGGPRSANLERALQGVLAEGAAFSGTVRVTQHGAPLFEHRGGFALWAEGIPIRIDTRFGTASGSKIFTAVATLQLVERGDLALDTPVADLLGGAYEIDPRTTVAHLLTHTSGMPDYYDEEDLSEDDCLRLMARHAATLLAPADYLPLFPEGPAHFEPGTRFRYCNGGFVLLAWIVERIAGVPFQEFVTEHVFRRAGMADAGYFRMDQLPDRTAYGYLRDGAGLRTNIHALPVIGCGDGGAFVNAPDWGRFWGALLGHRLLSEATTRAMLQPRTGTGPRRPERRYGLGVWLTVRDDALTMVYVEGADFGVRMLSGVFPESGIDTTVLDNVGDGADRIWKAVREVVA